VLEEKHSQPDILTSRAWLNHRAWAGSGSRYHCPILDDSDESFEYNLVPLCSSVPEQRPVTVKSLRVPSTRQGKKTWSSSLVGIASAIKALLGGKKSAKKTKRQAVKSVPSWRRPGSRLKSISKGLSRIWLKKERISRKSQPSSRGIDSVPIGLSPWVGESEVCGVELDETCSHFFNYRNLFPPSNTDNLSFQPNPSLTSFYSLYFQQSPADTLSSTSSFSLNIPSIHSTFIHHHGGASCF
jgi:hypothetical protein